MNGIRVEYTVKEDFIDTNRKNIENVMQELRKLGNNDVKYSAWQLEDKKIFNHILFFANAEAKDIVGNLESFKKFQTELKANVTTPPKAQPIGLVAAGYDIF